jgi:hypothetical protein
MTFRLGGVLPALALAVGMLCVVMDAGADDAYTMVPASAGVPTYSAKVYYVGDAGDVFTDDNAGISWVIPVPNYTGQANGGGAYIDLGVCNTYASGEGIAMDLFGNMEAVTGPVFANNASATSQWVSFGPDFYKTGSTYVSYYLQLSRLCHAYGVEYQQY